MPNCPLCSSDKVYSLLDTLHCKRCKNIWKEDEDPDRFRTCTLPVPEDSLRIRKKTDSLETRLEKRLQQSLARHGKFSLETMPWQAGDISRDVFRRYLVRCVLNRSLEVVRDRYGRVWYQRPG